MNQACIYTHYDHIKNNSNILGNTTHINVIVWGVLSYQSIYMHQYKAHSKYCNWTVLCQSKMATARLPRPTTNLVTLKFLV